MRPSAPTLRPPQPPRMVSEPAPKAVPVPIGEDRKGQGDGHDRPFGPAFPEQERAAENKAEKEAAPGAYWATTLRW